MPRLPRPTASLAAGGDGEIDPGTSAARLLVDGEPPRRVVLVRALPGIGDILCAAPAWAALRRALPDAHIALVGVPAVAPLLDRLGGCVDELIPFVGFPGVVESATSDAAAITAALAAVQARRFDLAVQMHGSGLRTNPFAALLGARAVAGFHLPGQYCPDPDRFLPYPAGEPEVRRHLRLVEHLGVPAPDEAIPLHLHPEDEREAHALLQASGVQGPYVCVHPGASIAKRRWPPEHFAEVGDALAARGLSVVVTGGRGERDVAARVVATMRAHAVDVSGRTSLGGLAAVVAGGRMVITNDTGASHLAAALRTPSVVVFTASDPVRWAPLDRSLHRAVGLPRPAASLPCHAPGDGCLGEGCLASDPYRSPLLPAPADVTREALDLLATHPVRGAATPA